MAMRKFSLEEGLRRVKRCNIIAIPSDENREFFRNMEDRARGSDDIMSALMATLS